MIYLITLITLFLDQLSKVWAYETLPEHQFVPVCPFFNLFLTYNKGVSFSAFTTDKAYGPFVLSGVSCLICMFLIWWLYKEKNKVIRIALAMVLGGAIGNVIDRIRLGAVIDFLDVYYNTYHWPAFNVADSAICCGAFLIFTQLFFQKKDIKKEDDNEAK